MRKRSEATSPPCLHVGVTREEKEILDQAALDWLKRNHPAGSKSEAWRSWLLEGAKREREKP